MAGTNPDLVIRVAANIAALQSDMAAAVATLKTIEGAATATAGATTQLAGSTDGLGSSWVARIAEGVLLRDAIRDLLSATEELAVGIPEEARDLRNLSLQTQINIEDLQVITAATREYGVEGDQLGKALFQLSQRIAGGDENVATAYHLMGMSLDEVKAKSPIDLFLATEHGLGTLSGAIQDTAAKDLYGARLGASLIAFSHGADDAVKKARELNTVASTESVQAAAAYADAIDRATHSVHAWFMEIEGGAAMGFNTITDAAAKGASKWDLFKGVMGDWMLTTLGAGGSATGLATLIDHLNQTAASNKDIVLASAAAHNTVTVALTAQEQAQRFMAATELDAAKPLLAWQVEYLGHLKDIGLLTAQNAAGIGVSVDQLKKYEEETKAALAAEKERDAILMTSYANRIKGLQDVARASLASYGFGAQIAALSQLDAAERALSATVFNSLTSEKDRAKVIEETITRHIELMNQETAIQLKQAKVVNDAVIAEFEAQVQLNAAQGLTASGAIASQVTASDRLTAALDQLHAAKVAGISQSAQEQVLIDAYTKSLYDDALALDAVNTGQEKVNAGLAAVPALQAAARNAMQGVGFAGETINAAWVAAHKFDPAASAEMEAARMRDIQGGINPANDPTLVLWDARAAGGPVSAGSPYLVGERGPELFVPSASGAIVPNGAMGGNVTVQVIVQGSVLSDEKKLAAAVGQAVMNSMRNQGTRLPSGA